MIDIDALLSKVPQDLNLTKIFEEYVEKVRKETDNKNFILNTTDKKILFYFTYLSVTEETLILFLISPCPLERACGKLFKEEKLKLEPILGSVHLKYSMINRLPDNLCVKGDLILLHCTQMEYLPLGLKVFGELDLRGTKITEIPRGTAIGGNLHLNKFISDVSLIKVKGVVYAPQGRIEHIKASATTFLLEEL